jgi:hypothetical protein
MELKAEAVYEVAQALDNTQRERLCQLLNTDTDNQTQKNKPKKKQLWDENELRKRIINDFRKRAREFKEKNTLPYSSLK